MSEGAAPAPAPAAAETAAPPAEAEIELRGLTIAVPGQVLLEGATLTVRKGERLLLVGPSGSGKSVLLRLLTGLLAGEEDYRLSGSARVCGVELVGEEGRPKGDDPALRDAVGIVFQDHALLDELTAGENVAFARDHSRSAGAAAGAERALGFLKEHGIPAWSKVRTLSGGQRQRVAVARALARAPRVLFFDEPTSALDPRSSRAVAELIAETGKDATPVVVTHDYAPFRGVATRVVLLDPTTRTLRELPWEELDSTMNAPLAPKAAPAEPPSRPGLLAGSVTSAREGLLDLLEGTPGAALTLLRALPRLFLPVGARPSWLLRWLLHYSRITFLGSAIPYNVIAGVIAGFVATYFTYKFLPRPELTEPLIQDDVLPALGFALYRIVVPVLVTILIAGRTGAALASDFGNRVYHHQTLAMRSLGAPASAYLGTTACWASLVGTLVVAAIAFWSATLTSLAVFTAIQEHSTPFYWQGQFWRRLGGELRWGVVGTGWEWVALKLLASGLGVAAIAWFFGTRPKRSTADVSRGITLSVYWGTVFVLLVHFLCAFQEFERIRFR